MESPSRSRLCWRSKHLRLRFLFLRCCSGSLTAPFLRPEFEPPSTRAHPRCVCHAMTYLLFPFLLVDLTCWFVRLRESVLFSLPQCASSSIPTRTHPSCSFNFGDSIADSCLAVSRPFMPYFAVWASHSSVLLHLPVKFASMATGNRRIPPITFIISFSFLCSHFAQPQSSCLPQAASRRHGLSTHSLIPILHPSCPPVPIIYFKIAFCKSEKNN